MSLMNPALARVLRTRASLVMTTAARQSNEEPKPRAFESTRVTDARRFEDAPPPTEDDMISKFNI